MNGVAKIGKWLLVAGLVIWLAVIALVAGFALAVWIASEVS